MKVRTSLRERGLPVTLLLAAAILSACAMLLPLAPFADLAGAVSVAIAAYFLLIASFLAMLKLAARLGWWTAPYEVGSALWHAVAAAVSAPMVTIVGGLAVAWTVLIAMPLTALVMTSFAIWQGRRTHKDCVGDPTST
ncbi:MAG: hypothetical protein K2P58_08170 [Hyphomonadaceae bacterium]|nr:hypothetical protein [Hyphomonadaceae bacterium]